jgi:hypothetical protein
MGTGGGVAQGETGRVYNKEFSAISFVFCYDFSLLSG